MITEAKNGTVLSLPTLYKKTSTGAIQFWTVSVESEPAESLDASVPGVIKTVYGQVGTDSPQETTEVIREGKNIGRANETTAVKQAIAKAEASWTGKKKRGYVEAMAAAEEGHVDNAVIVGGVEPMLAHKYRDYAHKIVYPVYAQPKLDGIRCVALVKDGVCTLWTRTRKPIVSCPHIVAAVERLGFQNMILDGELYNHTHKHDFEAIVSGVRKEYASKASEVIQYHIYDTMGDGTQNALDLPFAERTRQITALFSSTGPFNGPLVKVETRLLEDEDAVLLFFEEMLALGYEGLILRNSAGPYLNRRSYDLQKMKSFDDDEFEIVGIEEGKGKLAGHIGKFICLAANGKEFKPMPRGTHDFLRRCFEDPSLWKGKTLVVKYQGLTKYGIPRVAKGIRFRDSEDF